MKFKPRLAEVIAALSAMALASCSNSSGLPSRDQALKLLNESGPSEHVRSLIVCDVSGFAEKSFSKAIPSTQISPSDKALLEICLRGSRRMGKSNNDSEDVVGVFLPENSLAAMQTSLGPLGSSSFFGGYGHSYIYWTTDLAKLAAGAGDFARVEDLADPFVRLELKSFKTSIGSISGIREPAELGEESECTAIVDYQFAVSDKAPWADAFISKNSDFYNGTHSACLTKYDDGWRVTKRRMKT